MNMQVWLDGQGLNGAEEAKPLALGGVDHQANLMRTPWLSIPGQAHPLKESGVLSLNLFRLAQKLPKVCNSNRVFKGL